MKKNEIDSLLMTVAFENVVRIHKKKLLWMLGWKYDKAGAWQQLLEAWEDLEYDKSCFYGFEHENYIVLVYSPIGVDLIEKWAS